MWPNAAPALHGRVTLRSDSIQLVNAGERPSPGVVATASKAVLWIALYVLGIWYADVFVHASSQVTIFWPASGIAFAAVVGLGLRWAVIIPVAVLIAHATFATVPLAFVPFSVLSNLLGAIAGAAVLRVARASTTHRSISVLAILVGAVAMAAAAAAIGTAGLVYAEMVPPVAATASFVKWALGDLLGIACIAPTLLLLIVRRSRSRADAPTRADFAPVQEKILWVLAYAGAYLFLYWAGSQDTIYAIGTVAFPLGLLVWSAFRFERLWTTLATLVAVFVVTSLTGLGLAAFEPPRSTLDAVLLLSVLNLVAILPLMLMETIHAQHVGARRSLRLLSESSQLQQEQLEDLVAERTRQLDEANHQLEHASQTDALTGLRNRRYVARQLPLDLAFYEREALSSTAPPHALFFALVDIDHFKQINDRFGHKAGDEVLQQFAEALVGLVRSSDYAIRWGGEEFLLVLRPMPAESVTVVGDRICSHIASRQFQVTGHPPLSVTCSVGFSERDLGAPGPGLPWEQLVELADAALYWVKQNGRDNWAVLRPAPGLQIEDLAEGLRGGAQAAIDAGAAVALTGQSHRRRLAVKPAP